MSFDRPLHVQPYFSIRPTGSCCVTAHRSPLDNLLAPFEGGVPKFIGCFLNGTVGCQFKAQGYCCN